MVGFRMGCNWFAAGIVAAVLVMCGSALGQQVSQATRPLSPAALVAAFDEQIQVRFLDTRLGFGISRLCGPMSHGALGQMNQTLRRLPQPSDPVGETAMRRARLGTIPAPATARKSGCWARSRRANVEIWSLLVSWRAAHA